MHIVILYCKPRCLLISHENEQNCGYWKVTLDFLVYNNNNNKTNYIQRETNLTFGMIPHIIQERSVEQDVHHTGEMAQCKSDRWSRDRQRHTETHSESVPSLQAAG